MQANLLLYWAIILAIASHLCLLLAIYMRFSTVFETLRSQIQRLLDVIPALTAHIKSLTDENAALKQQLTALQTGVSYLPAIDASLTAAVDSVVALVPPAV